MKLLPLALLALLCAPPAASVAQAFQFEQTLASATPSSLFGASVALSGNVAIFGAPLDNFAEIHRFDGASWTREAILSPAVPGFTATAVDIDGSVAIVGDWTSGAAHIYRHNGSAWIQEAALASPVVTPYNGFGGSVAIEGNRAVVGSFFEDQSGVAYVYEFDQGQWTVEDRLAPSDGAVDDHFGTDVAISGGTILVGSPNHGSANSGASYFYDLDPNGWQENQIVFGVNDKFGVSVALEGDAAAIGASFDNHAGAFSGAAYVYGRSGGDWTQSARLTADDATIRDQFGRNVDLSGGRVVVGTGTDDGQDPDPNHGAYLFTSVNGSWSQTAKVPLPGNGVPVTIDGTRFMAGRDGGQGAGSVRSYVIIPEPSSLVIGSAAVVLGYGRRRVHQQCKGVALPSPRGAW
jgi:hypothetical protein